MSNECEKVEVLRVTEEKAGRRRSGGVRDEYKALTRQRLTDAAFAEFEEHGYAQSTIEDLARRAGTSRATFYTHFGSKSELVEGLWDVVRRSLIKLYRDLARAEVRDRAFMEQWLTLTFEFYQTNRQRLLAIHEGIALEPELAAAYYDRTQEVVDLVAPLIESGRGVARESARFHATLLTIQHERFCFFWILRQMPFDREEALHTFVEIWFEQVGHDVE